MMPELLVAVAAGVALYLVVAPLRDGPRLERETDPTEELVAGRNAALGALLELADDRAAGKLSDADFEQLIGRYEVEAAAALRRLEVARERAAVADRELEAEIAAARKGLE